MKFRAKTLWAVAGVLLLASSTAYAAPADDAAIKAVEAGQEASWNAHDAHAFAQLFTADATLISALGSQLQSRVEIEQKLGAAFASVFAQSSLHIEDIDVRSLSDDVALAYIHWSMTGVKGPYESSQKGIQTQILRKSDGRWLILSYQNTAIAPQRALPATAAEEPTAAAQEPKSTKLKKRCLLANKSGSCLID